MVENNEKSNNSNQNPLSLEEENLLKGAMTFLQEEYNIKKEKLKLLKQESSQTKKQFQSQLQEYQKDTQLTIEKEKEIQLLFSKISKRKKRRALIIKNSFNNKFYSHLLEISTNKKKEKILKNFFSLIMVENNQEKRNIKELIEILKNEDEILYAKVKALLSKDVDSPIILKELVDDEIYNKLSDDKKMAYMLKLADKYCDLRKRYIQENNINYVS